MDRKSNHIKLKEFDNNFTKFNYTNNREKIKSKIMDKYGISLEESEKILDILEKRVESDIKQNQSNDFLIDGYLSDKRLLNSKDEQKVSSSQSVLDGNSYINSKNNYIGEKAHARNTKVDAMKQIDINIKSSSKINLNGNYTDKINFFRSEDEAFNKETSYQSLINNDKSSNEKLSTDVDSILENIIPDFKQQISIKVDHVDLTFEVQSEKIDTLKEAFIRTIKRNKSDKIKIHALNDVSFQIYKGEKVGIIGYNGAGKSTLLNVISGIYIPDKGSVTTYGNISPLLSLGAGFDYNFSGRQNIILNGAVLGYTKEFLESKIDEIIEFSELGEFIDIPIKNYSSGMLAKLGFSIATMVNPDILIIDEILGVGDVNFQKKSADKIKSLMGGGTTVILVSHSIFQIRQLCDKAIWIDNGSVKAIGEVNKVCDEYLKDAENASNNQLANIQLK